MKKLQCKEIIKGLPPVLTENDTVSLDLELSGLNDAQLHRPAGRMASLACCFDGETAYIIFEEDEVQEFLGRIEKATFIFHNATFDLAHLRRWAKVEERTNLRDIMIIEKLIYSDYYDDFALNDLVRRYLGCYMPKDVREEFITLETAMTPEQIEYAALDVIGTFLVDQAQQKNPDYDKQDQLIWEKIDLPTVWTAIDLSGFELDRQAWINLAEDQAEIVERIEENLGKKYGHMEDKTSGRGKNKITSQVFVPFNPASPAQVLEILKAKGLNVESTGDDEISPFAGDEFVDQILEYRHAAKKVSTYGISYLKYMEEDDRIYPSLNVIGTTTGRNSCRNPNLQQIPRAQEYRECFVAGYGRKLIIADYNAQEVRIFAHICGDESLIDIFNSGKDVYCEIALRAFHEVITKKENKERRNVVKALVLGLIFGLTPFGFARDNKMEVEDAEEMYNAFFEAFPKAKQWVDAQQAVNKKITRTILGRKSHLHPYNPKWENNALNNPMQGSGADMTKLAMKEFRKVTKNKMAEGMVGIVLPVHDEIVIWSAEIYAEEMLKTLETCMVKIAELIHPTVPGVVEAHICDNWSEK